MAKRKTGAQWRRFLGVLARTGNARVAAAAAGMDVATAYDRRIRDAAFAVKWVEAVATAKGRPSPQPRSRPPDGIRPHNGRGRSQELVLRRTKHGDKLVRAGAGRWNARAEAVFLAELRRTGCVRWAATECGFSTNALYKRRENYPDFAARWAAAEAAALQRIPTLLSAATIASLDPEVEDVELPSVNVDQAIAIARLKAGGAREGAHGRGSKLPFCDPVHDLEGLRARLHNKIERLGKRVRAEQLAKGWIESEDGHMIPPGWVHAGKEEDGG